MSFCFENAIAVLQLLYSARKCMRDETLFLRLIRSTRLLEFWPTLAAFVEPQNLKIFGLQVRCGDVDDLLGDARPYDLGQ